MNIRDGLKKAKRVVVKVGTSTITLPSGETNLTRMEELVRELAALKVDGREIVLVSSGAIATGMNHMKIKVRPKISIKKRHRFL